MIDYFAANAVRKNVAVELEQYQFDALVCLAFNIGAHNFAGSTLVKLLNQGEYDQVPEQMRRWNYVAGVVSGALTLRREREIKMWLGQAA
jgi:lysozyme